MNPPATPEPRWQKSSFSGVDGEDCVEVTHAEPHLLLRESDDPTIALTLSPPALLSLIRQTKDKTET
ncbi:protein of unknown function [Streptomyces sp. yr375]|uniref:DUF397 domain-containing protein n=1 Tax=Streptomyces sp. yr375 TaxID=1761906 RepID=UPI0008C8675B|nr:DUF397 domain-containing protein [Streptomyces sp. yr375]SES47608.1 protein of unknown function [Streptomyces sp. yr375]